MREVAKRLVKLMKERKVSYGKLARLTDISTSALQRYGSGAASIPCDRLESIAQALNVSPTHLMGWSSSSSIPHGARVAPIIESLYATNYGGEVQKICDGFAPLIDSALVGEYYYYKAKDDSMSPAIQEGDLALVRPQKTAKEDDYAMVMVQGAPQAIIRHVQKTRRAIVLTADNPVYPLRIFPDERRERVIIFGKIIGVVRRFE